MSCDRGVDIQDGLSIEDVTTRRLAGFHNARSGSDVGKSEGFFADRFWAPAPRELLNAGLMEVSGSAWLPGSQARGEVQTSPSHWRRPIGRRQGFA
jgi:hypothetical protein